MKKRYETPELMIAGDIVRDTLGGDVDECENTDPISNRLKCPGSMGYYL